MNFEQLQFVFKQNFSIRSFFTESCSIGMMFYNSLLFLYLNNIIFKMYLENLIYNFFSKIKHYLKNLISCARFLQNILYDENHYEKSFNH